MKIAHTADVHYCPKHLKWVDLAFRSFVDKAIEEECDVAVIAGDTWDHQIPLHEPSVAAFVKLITKLANHMPVLVLQGTFSHDRPGSLDFLYELSTTWQILVADQSGVFGLTFEKEWERVG